VTYSKFSSVKIISSCHSLVTAYVSVITALQSFAAAAGFAGSAAAAASAPGIIDYFGF